MAALDDFHTLEDKIDKQKGKTNIMQGQINEIKTKSGGNWTIYSLNVDNTWYGCFVNKGNRETLEALGEGDVIEFEPVAKGDYWNVKDNHITQVSKATPAKKAELKAVADTRQYQIFVSGTQKTAGHLVAAMLLQDILPVPSTKADKYAYVMETVKAVTAQLCEQTQTVAGDLVAEAAIESLRDLEEAA